NNNFLPSLAQEIFLYFIDSLDGQNDETCWLIRMSLIGQSASVALISQSPILLHTVRDTLGSQKPPK
ncbi:MAG: hypothetical protein M3299_14785, partial [Thermoproteota archaeon]|nr:hypothetical protein [Thermoproteota archaeon]